MGTSTVGVVIPFTRPRFVSLIRENLARQRFRDFVPIIVENGPGLGAWPAGDAIVVRSAAHRAHARNAGIAKCRELGLPFFAIVEDDDEYAPGYLGECWARSDRADVIGQRSYFMRSPDGRRWHMNPGAPEGPTGDQPGFVSGLLAATLFGRTDRALPFTDAIPVGEEILWYTDMRDAGRTLWVWGPGHFTQVRYADPTHGHAMPGWEREVRAMNAIQQTSEQTPASSSA